MRAARSLITVFLAVILLSGCAGAAPAQRPPLRVEWTLWEGDYTILIAQEMGFFEKHGVQVELVYYDDYYQVVPDLAGAVIDGGLLAIGDLLMTARLTDVSAVMAYDSGGVDAIVAAPGIQSFADLRGKRIGVNLGTSGEVIIRAQLELAGLTAHDVTLVEMDAEQIPAAIPTLLDAGYLWEPYTSQAVALGHTLLYSGGKNSVNPDLVVFRRPIIDDRPEDIRAFIAAWFEAVAWRQEHPIEALAIIMRVTGLGADELGITGEDVYYALEDNQRLFADPDSAEPGLLYDIVQSHIDFLAAVGDLTEAPKLNQVLDPSYFQEANSQ